MDAYIVGAFPLKINHKTAPNTPDEAVALFLANNPTVRCDHYRCLLTVKECKARKRKALLAKRLTYHGYKGNAMATGEAIRLHKCVNCRRTP